MKRLIGTIAVLFLFLIFAFFRSTDQAKKNQTPTVGILQLTSHPALDEIHRGIIAALKEEGFISGKNIKIDFQNAENDQSNLGAGLVKDLKHPGGNITGVQHKEPIALQLQLIKTIMPELKTIGVLHTSSDDSSAAEVKEFSQLAQKTGIKVKEYTITSTNDIQQVSATMASNVQAIYIPNDNTVASGFQTVLKNANQNKIPIFPSTSEMTRQGGLATVSVSQYELGKMTGKMTAAILKGKDPADMAIEYPTKGTTYLNQKQAQQLWIDLPNELVTQISKKGVVIK